MQFISKSIFIFLIFLGFAFAEEHNSSLSDYKLDSGDVISISVFGEDDLTVKKIRLTEKGTITFPSVGEISVLGKRNVEVEDLIASKLRGRILVNPKVSVQVDEYRPFYITGGVKKPGSFPYISDLTVNRAISIAGGFTDKADRNKMFILSASGDKRKVVESSTLSPGDNVQIEEYDPIFVNGLVNKPGSYPFINGLNVRKAIALAGGFHERAAQDKIYVIKASNPREKPAKIKIDDPVEPGDILTIDESFF